MAPKRSCQASLRTPPLVPLQILWGPVGCRSTVVGMAWSTPFTSRLDFAVASYLLLLCASPLHPILSQRDAVNLAFSAQLSLCCSEALQERLLPPVPLPIQLGYSQSVSSLNRNAMWQTGCLPQGLCTCYPFSPQVTARFLPHFIPVSAQSLSQE